MSSPRSLATPRFLAALDYAVRLHGEDFRKGTTIPYATHLLGTCALVLLDGGGEDEAIAALLHDALEDHPERTSRQELLQRFGPEVLAIVEACTDTPTGYRGGPKPPWRGRKMAYLAHLRTASPEIRRVALADKVDNLRAILADYRQVGDELWTRFSVGKPEQLWMFRCLAESFREAGATGPLSEEFTRLVDELERVAGEPD